MGAVETQFSRQKTKNSLQQKVPSENLSSIFVQNAALQWQNKLCVYLNRLGSSEHAIIAH